MGTFGSSGTPVTPARCAGCSRWPRTRRRHWRPTYTPAGSWSRCAGAVVRHLLLVDAAPPGELEIKNMAVRESLQGRGIGARLVRAALDAAAAAAGIRLVVATAAADTGNLRFYQRQGFRMRCVERDAF